MKFDVDDKNRCRPVCVKFHLNRCRFVVAVAKCLGGSLFGTQCSYTVCQSDYIMHIMLMQAAKEFLTLKLAKQTAITIMQEAAAQKKHNPRQ